MPAVKAFTLDCLRLLWMVFFRAESFRAEVEAMHWRQHIRLAVRAIVVIVVTSLVLDLLIGLLLASFGIYFNFAPSLSVVEVGVAFGVTMGVVVGLIGSVAFGVAFGVEVGVVASVAFGVAGGVALGVAIGLVFGGAFSVAFGVAFSAAFGVVFSDVFVVRSGVMEIVAGGVIGSVVFGIVVGAVAYFGGGTVIGLPPGWSRAVLSSVSVIVSSIGLPPGWSRAVLSSVTVIVSFLIFYLRIPFFLIGALTSIRSLWRTRVHPQLAARFLHQSLAYWDELALLPQPFLWRLVVAVGKESQEAGTQAITHLVINTHQRRAAEKALLELGSRELLDCKTVGEIAERAPSYYWFASTVAIETIALARGRMMRALEAFLQGGKIAAEIGSAVSATSNFQKLTRFNRARKLLEEFHRFAVLGLRGRESQNFVRIAQQWLDAVNAEIDRLSSDETIAREIPNPFVAPSPLLPERGAFLGREDVFRTIEGHFLRPHQNAPLVIFGQPRIGKTSVLRHLHRLPTNLIPVYVDMQQEARVESTGGLLFNLADAINKELAGRGQGLKPPQLGDYRAEPFIIFRQFLDSVEKAIGAPENRLLVALDEFEEIEKKIADGVIAEDFLAFLRSTMQHRTGISLIFAGTHALNEMASERWASYFRSALPVRVSYLDRESAETLIINPIPDFPLDYDAEAVELLIAQTHCHPCLIQLTCSALVDLKNKRLLADKAAGRHATAEDVRQALAAALQTGDLVFSSIWQWMPPGERKLLALIASASAMSTANLARKLQLPTAETRGMVERLIEAEVLMRDEGEVQGEGLGRFQVEMFRQWVARHAVRSGMDVS